MDSDLSRCRRVFMDLVDDTDTRKALGARKRKLMHDAVDAGDSNGPRATYIKNMAGAVLELMAEFKEDFDGANLDDWLCDGDCMDALATALALIRRR